MWFTAKWLIVLSSGNEIHLLVIMLNIIVVLIAIALVVTFVTQVSLVVVILIALEIVYSVGFSFVDYVGSLLVLHLENTQAINIEDPPHFYVQLLFNFYLFSLGKDSCILIVNYC